MMCTRAKMKFVGKMKIIGIDREASMRSSGINRHPTAAKPQRQRDALSRFYMLSDIWKLFLDKSFWIASWII